MSQVSGAVVLFFFSIGLLVGGEGRGSLGVKVENPNV